MSWYPWVISVVALLGLFFDIRKKPVCFAFWAFTNASWVVIDYQHGILAQAVVQYFYFTLSLYGFLRWTAEPARGRGDLEVTTENGVPRLEARQ